jgi:hypothetical protein
MTTSTKSRNQSPAVAQRKMLRSIMNRANAIAKNAYNAHNTSLERIATFGAATTMQEFIAVSMQLAWEESRTGQTLYTMVGKLPRKTMPRIHSALAMKVTQTNADTFMSQSQRFYIQAKTMLIAKTAGDPSQEEIKQAYNIAYAGQAPDLNYALTA